MSKTNAALIALFVAWGAISFSASENPAATRAIAAPAKPVGCQPSDIAVKSVKAGFVDTCRQSSCPRLQGVAVITNRCPTPARIEMQLTALDSSGSPVATRSGWPASIDAIPPGDYTFSLDLWLDYDPQAKSFDLSVATVREPR